jgi:hypothetical protein
VNSFNDGFRHKTKGVSYSLGKNNSALISKFNKEKLNANNKSQALTKTTLEDRFYEYCKN